MRAVTAGKGRYWAVWGCLAAMAFAARYRPLPPTTAQSRDVILATTTSTRDAGLLDSLLPVFERQTRYTVKVIAVGSGQALAMGRRGDADVVLSHAPDAERALVDSGYFVRRRMVMHNEFLVVGPAADPAGLRGLSDPAAAFRKIGGFSDKFFAAEELELTQRLRKHAKENGKRIVILHRHPLVTSARKMHLYTKREHLRFLARIIFSNGRALASRDAAHLWYHGRR